MNGRGRACGLHGPARDATHGDRECEGERQARLGSDRCVVLTAKVMMKAQAYEKALSLVEGVNTQYANMSTQHHQHSVQSLPTNTVAVLRMRNCRLKLELFLRRTHTQEASAPAQSSAEGLQKHEQPILR